uniref:Phosphatidylinositol4phosphate5kinase (PiPIPKD2) putative n=1 Tax=Albugo laibachii Nc14 TaxID=890382 RepID=F0W3E2_9STRA|nr:phosphatidylinositol4phosphate5kinase (PiPIPKD2) putative [Albugo laibachii Nc14]|eukprot:CCA15585.1 phosphatidylinositol4phosphate5kinase (PiPIPKD2) putative [Albugo laibachii Nc14]
MRAIRSFQELPNGRMIRTKPRIRTKQSNHYLGGMGKDFDRAEGLLGGTMRKLGIMMDQGGKEAITYTCKSLLVSEIAIWMTRVGLVQYICNHIMYLELFKQSFIEPRTKCDGAVTIGETRLTIESQMSRCQLPVVMEKRMLVYKAQREDSLRDVASRYDMNVNELKALNKMTSDEIDEGQLIKVYRRKRSNSLPIVPFFQDLLSYVGIYDTKSTENEAFPELHESLEEHSTASTPPKNLQIDDTENQEELRSTRRNNRSYSEQIPLPVQDMLPLLIGGSNAELLPCPKYRHALLPRLEQSLPYRFRGYNWQLLYSTARHGSSLHTLLARVSKVCPTILIIKTVKGDVLGGFAPTCWENFNTYYGIGESFVFTCWPYFKVFPWSKENSMFMFSNGELIAMGGGGDFAWSLDSDLSRGTTGESKTFQNPCLASSFEFTVSSVEVWGFIEMENYNKKRYPATGQHVTAVDSDTELPQSTHSIPPYVTQNKTRQQAIRTELTNTGNNFPPAHLSAESGMHIRHKSPTRSIELRQHPAGSHMMSHHSSVPPQSSSDSRNQLTNRLHPLPPPNSYGNPYHSMTTPVEEKQQTRASQRFSRIEAEKSGISLAGDSQDNHGDKETVITHSNDDLGWFHGKIKVENAIQWSNNYRIQLLMLLMFIVGASTTVIFANNSAHTSVGLVCGGLITMVSSAAVIYTFVRQPTWRKHPNPIIFFRSLCDMCLVLILLSTELYKCTSLTCEANLPEASCSATAGLTQFFLWASESWFFVMAIDMLSSLQSPFTDYKRNVRRYHAFVWITAIFTSLFLISYPNWAGPSEFGYCWTRTRTQRHHSSSSETDANLTHIQLKALWKFNVQSWVLFYIWLIMFWIYAITVLYVAWKRLQSGLSETLRMRIRVLHSVTFYVIAIIIYWGITFIIYVPYLTQTNPQEWIVQLMSFMITCKGYFDFVVWFQMNKSNDALSKGEKNKGANVDVDVDLSPQVNLALRCEVLYYTTTGIIQAVRDTQHLPPGASQQELYLQPQKMEESRDGSLGVDDYLLRTKSKGEITKGTLFIDYCPHTFQTIREHFGIDTSQYISSLSRTTKERLSEGASGAFMFFSHDQQLIVKSMSNEESVFLRSIAAEYASFLLNNPDSLLTRFYGCHAIRLYGNTFNFVVMANLFSTDRVINRRYDIKGSYVNRSAKHPSKGKRVTCRHCNAKYVFGSTDAENCRARVGRHEPNVVLKDNDLTSRVRLDPSVAVELYDQLVKDATFLSRLGIMDYSLLLGVHNVEYTVSDMEHSTANQELESMRQSQRKGLPRLMTGTRRANTVVGPSVYYFGIIDILQTWNMDKKLERFVKVKILGNDPDGISAIPSQTYCERFKRKMAEILSVSTNEDDEIHDEAEALRAQSIRFM